MFRKKVALLTFVWIVCIAIVVVIFGRTNQKDREAYQQLMSYSNVKDRPSYKGIKQQRYNVTKHLLLNKGPDQRNQFYLRSASSDLMCKQDDTCSEVVEYFNNVSCIMQESIDNNLQTVRQIEAEKAEYHYKNEALFAEQVKIARFQAPGKEINFSLVPSKMLMKGTATQVQLFLTNQEKPFKAEGLKATFYEDGFKL